MGDAGGFAGDETTMTERAGWSNFAWFPMKWPCIFLFSLAMTAGAGAWSISTEEGARASRVARWMEFYAMEHEGRLPGSWADLELEPGFRLQDEKERVAMTKRYAFLEKPLRLTRPLEGEVLVMSRNSFRPRNGYTNWHGGISFRLGEDGRRLICRTGDGRLQGIFLKEEEVEKAFLGSEHLLPVPDPELVRDDTKQLAGEWVRDWGVLTVLGVGGFWWLMRGMQKRPERNWDD